MDGHDHDHWSAASSVIIPADLEKVQQLESPPSPGVDQPAASLLQSRVGDEHQVKAPSPVPVDDDHHHQQHQPPHISTPPETAHERLQVRVHDDQQQQQQQQQQPPSTRQVSSSAAVEAKWGSSTSVSTSPKRNRPPPPPHQPDSSPRNTPLTRTFPQKRNSSPCCTLL